VEALLSQFNYHAPVQIAQRKRVGDGYNNRRERRRTVALVDLKMNFGDYPTLGCHTWLTLSKEGGPFQATDCNLVRHR